MEIKFGVRVGRLVSIFWPFWPPKQSYCIWCDSYSLNEGNCQGGKWGFKFSKLETLEWQTVFCQKCLNQYVNHPTCMSYNHNINISPLKHGVYFLFPLIFSPKLKKCQIKQRGYCMISEINSSEERGIHISVFFLKGNTLGALS